VVELSWSSCELGRGDIGARPWNVADIGCDAGPCGKMSSVDSGAPCGEGWREEARVVEIDASGNGVVG
jgi:hypothetical protein